jgi:E3 ubiquitin-protein ligase makorin
MCRYYAQGTCRLGSDCTFRHALPPKGSENVCQFYLAGSCAYGAKCRYDHVKVKAIPTTKVLRRPPESNSDVTPATTAKVEAAVEPPVVQPAAPLPPAAPTTRPWNAVVATAGAAEQLPDDLARLTVSSAGTGDRDEAPPPPAESTPAHDPWSELTQPSGTEAHAAVREDRSAALARSADVECCICLEAVLQKATHSERRFGLLSGCNHAFCLACIRDWRAGGAAALPSAKAMDHARTCPICREQSFYVIPSLTWPCDEAEKTMLVDAYKARLAGIPCRHFDNGRSSCPFGTSCWYAHRIDGVDISTMPLRKYGTADGEVRIVEPVRLAAFLER